MKLPLLLLGFAFVASDAFVPALQGSPARQGVSRWLAADGAPQYDKHEGVLQSVEKVGEGSFMLHVEVADKDAVKLDYQPGHVLALELEDTSDDLNEDAKKNGGWMRGPYTVSRSTESSLDVLVRVVGKKSKAFSESPVGTPVRFGGKFKVPILEGIDKEEVKKVVLVSTGVGVGPCIGAIELALQDEAFPPIALFASYRESSHVACRDLLDTLAEEHAQDFQWSPIISSEVGRLSSSRENLDILAKSIRGLGVKDTHYHLIGNGEMVNEWKAGLEQAGVPGERVTIEMYFNHKAETDESAIDNIATAISASVAVEA